MHDNGKAGRQPLFFFFNFAIDMCINFDRKLTRNINFDETKGLQIINYKIIMIPDFGLTKF